MRELSDTMKTYTDPVHGLGLYSQDHLFDHHPLSDHHQSLEDLFWYKGQNSAWSCPIKCFSIHLVILRKRKK